MNFMRGYRRNPGGRKLWMDPVAFALDSLSIHRSPLAGLTPLLQQRFKVTGRAWGTSSLSKNRESPCGIGRSRSPLTPLPQERETAVGQSSAIRWASGFDGGSWFVTLRKIRLTFIVALCTLLFFTWSAACTEERKAAASETTEVAVSSVTAQTFTMESKALGETRRINVYLPPDYKEHPELRFPVLYTPDGGMKEDFPHVVDAVDSMSGWGTMRPVIVVGIENTQRRRDMTGPTDVETDKKIAPKVGGSAAFREFIRKELMPQIQAHYRTSEEKGIVGESLAGLFVVETFLLEPELFDAYIAISPSLWWNKQAIVKLAEERVKSLPSHKTLYLTSADEEDIVRDTQRLAEILRSATPDRLKLIFQPMPEQFHDTIYRAASPRAFRLIYAVPVKAAK